MRCIFGFLWVSFTLVVLLVPAKGAVAQTVYKEGSFDLANWSLFGPFATPEGDEGNFGDADARAPISGGNPGGYLRFSVTGVAVPIGSTVTWALLINDQTEYDPGSLGALERVDFDFDGRVPPEDRLNRVVTLAVEQGGFRWAAIDTRLFLDEKIWLSKWILGLQAEDFVALSWAEEDQPVNPDFSNTASPIKFGILTGHPARRPPIARRHLQKRSISTTGGSRSTRPISASGYRSPRRTVPGRWAMITPCSSGSARRCARRPHPT